MKEAEKLFVVNPMVYSKLKKYIWLKEDAKQKEGALAVFCQFLVMEIYIEGFATDEDAYIGKRAFNKPIVDIRKLDSKEEVVFIECEYEEKLYKICQTFTSVNPAVNKGKIIIFGAGNYGTEVYNQLMRRGMGEAIYCFIDSDEAKCNGVRYKEGLEIHNIDILSEMEEEFSVVEASKMYDEMETVLQAKKVKQRRFVYLNEHDEYMKINEKKQYGDGVQFNIGCLLEWCFKIFDKKIYYYGKKDAISQKTGRCLQLLDLHFGGFLHDKMEDVNEADDYLVEDILYDENFYILVDKSYRQKGRARLNALGLKIGLDYNLIDWVNCLINMDNVMLDLNLGYAYKEGEKYTGFAVYGEENENDYKIVTLGGSTTEENFNWEKCWPRFLYEKLSLEKNITVYNGGVAGYSSGQELIKLIRDVLPLKPDLIVVYDGLVDSGIVDTGRPFAFSYLMDIFKCARENMDTLGANISIDGDVSIDLGVKSGKSSFENWISNIEIMHAVAELYGIRFLSFVQPSRYYLMNKTKKVGDWLFSDISFWCEIIRKKFIDFREELQNRRIDKSHGYVTDLTGLFENQPEVYMDVVHLYETGNEIIAENIINIIYQNKNL